MQHRGVCGHKVDCGFTSRAAGDAGVMEAGIRQKADHALPRVLLASCTLLFQIGGGGMRFAERILLAVSSRQVHVHLRAMAKIEGDGT